jgi:hypothetical protein
MACRDRAKRPRYCIYQGLNMTLITALICFGIGALGAIITFLTICFIPEIEEFFSNKKTK